ncbi:MAG: acetyl-CoA acetyltransferase [Myxococcota bacterium]|nr:acetyl-CoA acetyltransferase [Myxococcota bacterium]
MNVVVMGVGFCGSFPMSGGLSYRELIARAASMAYADAGIEAWELDGAVSCEEDFVSGYAITDEYVPDQLGVQRKSVYTVPGDFLQGLGSAVMQIKTGEYKMLVVEAYSKASNILTKEEILRFAFDPAWNRLGVTPNYLAGIEMQRFLACSGYTEADVAQIVAANKTKAIGNPLAPYANHISAGDVLRARPIADPVTEPMIARPADAAVAVVIGAEDVALPKARKPVYISGTGWSSGNSILERRDHGISEATEIAAQMAYKEAGIADPTKELDAVYVSDLFAHRQLMHLEGMLYLDESMTRVNPDGGSLAFGDLYDANGGARFFDAVQQLRGEAGAHQVKDAKRIGVHGWRGLPTDSCAVVVVDGERRTA